MRPFTPDELLEDGKSVPAAGTLFIGDKGVILNNEIVPSKKMKEYRTAKGLAEPQAGARRSAYAEWIAHVKGGAPSQGSFLNAANCSEAIALAAAAMRYNRKIFNENKCAPPLLWDRENMKFTNATEPNQYLTREYREGWRLTSALA